MADAYSINHHVEEDPPFEYSDTSFFIYDSPQSDNRRPSTIDFKLSTTPLARAVSHEATNLSSASEENSPRDSESLKRAPSNSSPDDSPPDFLDMDQDDFKTDKMFGVGMDEDYDFEGSTFPMGEQAMSDLSLNPLDAHTGTNSNFDFGSAMSPDQISAGLFTGSADGFSPRNYNAGKQSASMQTSPNQMTVQPSKMFALGDSREHSPNSNGNPLSHEGSPLPTFGASPLTSSAEAFRSGPSGTFNPSGRYMPAASSIAASTASNSAADTAVKKWPCYMTVDPTPEKSRVETQIPIKLNLSKVPPGITRIHLPSHTISKPKFQTKPPHQLAEDCLELSCTLVCASAMQKGPEYRERALEKALEDEVPIRKDESAIQDDNDPTRPLNGGPVTICSGCIVRERKRAARKKTKKQDEEEEWAKDEAKRVIVFNCSENRDWCAPETKDVPVKEALQPLDSMFVSCPMRIACYCRHQSEKVGFQVIFTLKTSTGRVMAQAMSHSIMITDDHKQPLMQPGASAGFAVNNKQPNNASAMLTSGQVFNMLPQTFHQDMPFRTSFSTNDLQSLNRYQMPSSFSQHQPHFQRQYSNGGLASETSTATATPRTLSRPASPTDPVGHSQKKRRSGNLSRASSGLTMTRIDTTRASPGGIPNGPPTGSGTSAPPNSAFSFTAQGTSGFASPLDQRFPQQTLRNPNYQHSSNNSLNGPPTMHQAGVSSPSNEDPYSFYSAPTSQHASRAPSPTGHRVMSPYNSAPAGHALSTLPKDFQLADPPIIQRVIPSSASRDGGDEVTILGRGFCQGLDIVFGEYVATNTHYWGSNAYTCRVPRSDTLGPVQVVFKHQHHTAPAELRQMQSLMPQSLVQFSYQESLERAPASFQRSYASSHAHPQQIPIPNSGPQGVVMPENTQIMAGYDADMRHFIARSQQHQQQAQAPQPSPQQYASYSRGNGPVGMGNNMPPSRMTR